MDRRYWTDAGRSLIRNLRSRSFAKEWLSAGLRADAQSQAPRQHFFDAYPELEECRVDMGSVAFRAFNLDPTERFCLGGLAQIKKPRTIFEIGTYDGTATLILARTVPDATIYTLDLPSELVELAIWDAERRLPLANGPGEKFQGTPEAARITQLQGNSLDFDFDRFKGSIDLVLVDGNHQFDFVVSDSANALKMLAPDGMIIWDDYAPEHPGVVRAVDGLASEHHLAVKHLVPTDLVVYDASR